MPTFDPGTLVSEAFTDARGHNWLGLVIIGLTCLAFALRRWTLPWHFFHTQAGAVIITTVLSAIDAFIKAAASGWHLSVITSAVVTAVFVSLGLSNPTIQAKAVLAAKLARGPVILLLLGLYSAPARAVTCYEGVGAPAVTTQLVKLPFSVKGGFDQPSEWSYVTVTLGASYGWNFLWSSDCGVAWINLNLSLLTGVGASDVKVNTSAWSLSVLGGVGIYGGYVRLAVGCDILNLGPGAISGFATSGVTAQNCALYAGTGLQFAISNGAVSITPPSTAPPTSAALKPGWRDETAPAPIPIGFVRAGLRVQQP